MCKPLPCIRPIAPPSRRASATQPLAVMTSGELEHSRGVEQRYTQTCPSPSPCTVTCTRGESGCTDMRARLTGCFKTFRACGVALSGVRGVLCSGIGCPGRRPSWTCPSPSPRSVTHLPCLDRPASLGGRVVSISRLVPDAVLSSSVILLLASHSAREMGAEAFRKTMTKHDSSRSPALASAATSPRLPRAYGHAREARYADLGPGHRALHRHPVRGRDARVPLRRVAVPDHAAVVPRVVLSVVRRHVVEPGVPSIELSTCSSTALPYFLRKQLVPCILSTRVRRISKGTLHFGAWVTQGSLTPRSSPWSAHRCAELHPQHPARPQASETPPETLENTPRTGSSPRSARRCAGRSAPRQPAASPRHAQRARALRSRPRSARSSPSPPCSPRARDTSHRLPGLGNSP